MATIEDDFRHALDEFKKRLNPDEVARFQMATLKDVEKAAYDIQEKQRKTKTAKNLKRIQPFLQTMAQYTEIIEVFLNTSTILCFVWGPMKFMLFAASNLSTAFDVLLDAYKQISECFPLLSKYRELFTEDGHMRKLLVWIYEDILNFHRRALRVFSQPAWMKIFTATWKDFQGSFKPILNDLTRHRELIESTANLEQIQRSRDARLEAQSQFKALEEAETHRRKVHIIDWLAAADPEIDHAASSEARIDIPDTGRWILDQSSIKAWLNEHDSSCPMIWLNGKPGAGKTVLASVIIEECLKKLQLLKDVSLVFFYCKDKDCERNTFVSVAKAMLVQLLRQNPEILPHLFDECLKMAKPTLSSSEDCSRLLSVVLQVVPQTLLIIDGIDECELKERSKMLKFFTSNITGNGIRPGKIRGIFISQELNDIKHVLHAAHIIRLSKDHNELDIKLFTTAFARRIQKHFKLMPDAAREHIVNLVCSGAEGMFLFAKLVLQNLHDQENLESIYKELQPDTFPDGFEQAYARIVDRIFKNPNALQRRSAQKLLGWVTFSKRPLKWHEILGARSIDLENRNFDFELRQIPLDVRDICGSLIEVLPGERVQLVHKTARDYLIKHKCLDSFEEETNLAILCMQYLTFDFFEPDISSDSMLESLQLRHYAFLDYASLHWLHHLENSVVSLKTEDLGNNTGLGSAIREFFEMYDSGHTKNEKIHKEQLERCSVVEGADCYEYLLSLLIYAKSGRIAENKMDALGPLGSMITKIRAMLEELAKSLNRDPNHQSQANAETMQKLRQFYGEKLYKCSWHACYYFHEGFERENGLAQHTNRHEKPFCCTEMGCTRMYIGWSTEKELKQHMSQYHPDPEALSWKFPHVKKLPTKFQCNLCGKSYGRKNGLNTHQLREHGEERPFVCKVCEKGFVRKYELERHEGIHSKDSQEVNIV